MAFVLVLCLLEEKLCGLLKYVRLRSTHTRHTSAAYAGVCIDFDWRFHVLAVQYQREAKRAGLRGYR